MTRVYVAVAVAVAAGLLFFLPRLDGADGYTDEDYRFRLERPGPGWRFLHGPDARATADAILVAAHDETGNWCAIKAEPYSGALQQAAHPHGAIEALHFGEHDARRSATRLLFLRDGHLFQVWCWASGANLDPILAALTLTDGTVRARHTAPGPAAGRGVGWFVRDHRFVSTAHGLAVTAPPGWRLVTEPEMLQRFGGGDVGLVRRGAIVALKVWRGQRATRSGLRTGLAGRGIIPATGPQVDIPWPGSFDSAQSPPGLLVVMEPHIGPGGRPYLFGLARRGDQDHQLLLHADPSLGIDWGKVLSAFGPAPTGLDPGPLPPQDALSATASIRDGIYRDFQRRLRWGPPAEGWALSLAKTGLQLHDRKTGGRAELTLALTPGGDTPQCRRGEVDGRFGPTTLEECTVGRVEVRTWGRTPASEGLRAATELEEEARVVAGGHVVDNRCGFRLEVPGEGWTFEDRTHPDQEGVICHVVLSRGDAEAHAFAAFTPRMAVDPNLFRDAMRRDMLRTLGAPPPATRVLQGTSIFYAVATRGIPLRAVTFEALEPAR